MELIDEHHRLLLTGTFPSLPETGKKKEEIEEFSGSLRILRRNVSGCHALAFSRGEQGPFAIGKKNKKRKPNALAASVSICKFFLS